MILIVTDSLNSTAIILVKSNRLNNCHNHDNTFHLYCSRLKTLFYQFKWLFYKLDSIRFHSITIQGCCRMLHELRLHFHLRFCITNRNFSGMIFTSRFRKCFLDLNEFILQKQAD
jgi:hypothetical protein